MSGKARLMVSVLAALQTKNCGRDQMKGHPSVL